MCSRRVVSSHKGILALLFAVLVISIAIDYVRTSENQRQTVSHS